MPTGGQIDNPKGAFGYTGALTTGVHAEMQGPYAARIAKFRNASTVSRIHPGCAVILSTLSSLGDQVTQTTVIGSPLFQGVAITSAGLNTDNTTVSTAIGLGGIGSDWCDVVVEGDVHGALLTSGTTPGDLLVVSNSTVGASTALGALVSTAGGYLGVAPATAAGNYAIAGIALTSGTTGTTGFLTTAGVRGIVRLKPSIVGSISTA